LPALWGRQALLKRFAEVMAHHRDQGRLNLEVQRSLGAALRSQYGDVFERLPEQFVRLLLPLRSLRGPRWRDPDSPPDPPPPPPLFTESNFGPDTIAVLTESLAEGWETLRYIGNTSITREALAKRLLDLARTGERNPSRLCTTALVALLSEIPH
jgi:hypothetical protein